MTALLYKTVAEMIDQAGLSPGTMNLSHGRVSCKMKATTRQRRPLQTTRRTTSPTWLSLARRLKMSDLPGPARPGVPRHAESTQKK